MKKNPKNSHLRTNVEEKSNKLFANLRNAISQEFKEKFTSNIRELIFRSPQTSELKESDRNRRIHFQFQSKFQAETLEIHQLKNLEYKSQINGRGQRNRSSNRLDRSKIKGKFESRMIECLRKNDRMFAEAWTEKRRTIRTKNKSKRRMRFSHQSVLIPW